MFSVQSTWFVTKVSPSFYFFNDYNEQQHHQQKNGPGLCSLYENVIME